MTIQNTKDMVVAAARNMQKAQALQRLATLHNHEIPENNKLKLETTFLVNGELG